MPNGNGDDDGNNVLLNFLNVASVTRKKIAKSL